MSTVDDSAARKNLEKKQQEDYTIPSIPSEDNIWEQINERVIQLKLKDRPSLTLAELFEISRACP